MKIKTFLFFIFSCFIASLSFAYPHVTKGIAAYCFDGDTFKMKERSVVRLAGIDAPEVAHNDSKAQYYSRQSKDALISLVKGKEVYLNFPGVKNKDNYGRLIAEVSLPDGVSVNESMVERGAAFFYPHEDLGPEFQERLKMLQEEAIKQRRGMWKYILSSPIANKHYIGNRASLRFFPADCAQANRIKPRNKVNFENLMDAFLAGYAPARICPFWPEE